MGSKHDYIKQIAGGSALDVSRQDSPTANIQGLRKFFLGCSIDLYTGLPGAGKTFAACADILEKRKMFPGMRVYTNIPLNLPGHGEVIVMQDWQDLMLAKFGLVFIDEINLWMPSRVWSKMPGELLWKLAQVRKAGLYIIATSQAVKRVDRVFRELVFTRYDMQSWVKLGFFLRRQYEGCDGKQIGMWPIFKRKEYCNVYDTFQYVDLPSFVKFDNELIEQSKNKMLHG